ncbi:MAG: hypothetical protein ABL903_19590 [Methylococcales bacterium]
MSFNEMTMREMRTDEIEMVSGGEHDAEGGPGRTSMNPYNGSKPKFDWDKATHEAFKPDAWGDLGCKVWRKHFN